MNLNESIVEPAMNVITNSTINGLMNLINKKIAESWSIHTSKQEMKNYFQKIASYFYFYTITNPDQKVFIDDVYVPINLTTDGHHEISTNKLRFNSKSINVISGVAGHGKSTMLRHLMKLIILSDDSDEIPIFFELKSFKNEDIVQQLCFWLNNNGLNVTQIYIEKMLTEGKFSLLFDAFDELPHNLMDKCVSEIEKLHQKYPNTSIIVTTK